MKFSYNWNFSDYPTENNGLTVMSTFACGGGSSMGYKLAGFDVVAANDIDPQMAKVYIQNHKPKQFFECSVTDLKDRDDLPEVDILDGSPPCSVFSIAGLGKKVWGKSKKFREGQAEQVLDDLFFEFAKLAKTMNPKVVVAENVKSMLHGKAKEYAVEYVRRMSHAGYTTQVFIVDGSKVGLPQKRERVFFISNRMGKTITLDFNDPLVPFKDISDDTDQETNLSELYQNYYKNAKEGEPVGKFEARRKLWWDRPSRTVTASGANFHPKYPRTVNFKEELLLASFPQDYNFDGVKPTYLMGMSVPPLMMARVAEEIKKQLL